MKGQLSLKVGERITTGLTAALYRRPGADMGDQGAQEGLEEGSGVGDPVAGVGRGYRAE